MLRRLFWPAFIGLLFGLVDAGPGALSPADRRQMIDQYEVILWHDGHVGHLFDELEALGRLEKAVFIITSDLAPTIAELVAMPVPPSFDAGSLLPWLDGRRQEPRTVFFENPEDNKLGVHTPDWVYSEGRTGAGIEWWLYRRDDVTQQENLADRLPEVVAELHRRVTAQREMGRS